MLWNLDDCSMSVPSKPNQSHRSHFAMVEYAKDSPCEVGLLIASQDRARRKQAKHQIASAVSTAKSRMTA